MRINFTCQGQGEPVVLIHGLFGSLENLGSIARLLAQRFTVYSIDLPNHGRSPHTDIVTLPAMASALEQWILEQQLAHATLVGHSLGGKVAMELALENSKKVRAVVVIDISPVRSQADHSGIFEGLLALDIDNLRSRVEAENALKPYVAEAAIRSFLLKNLRRSSTGGYKWKMNLNSIHDGYPSLLRENVVGKVYAGPILFIRGGNSEYIQDAHKEEILSRFPKAKLKIVANTGHWLHAEKPQIVAKLIDKFLRSDK